MVGLLSHRVGGDDEGMETTNAADTSTTGKSLVVCSRVPPKVSCLLCCILLPNGTKNDETTADGGKH
jgi:hypothetical protein